MAGKLTQLSMILKVTLFFALSFPCFVSPLKHCQHGTYYDVSNEFCQPCPEGTFMPHNTHRHRSCYECMKKENAELEVLKKPCSKTDNSIIHCVEGYYRRLPVNMREKEICEKCTDCGSLYTTLPCRTYEDTHCCWGENVDVVPDRNGMPGCWELPWMCRRGQYFNRDTFTCQQCPPNTFMPLDYHILTECYKCQSDDKKYLPKHSFISRPCNATHPALLKCKDGYFIDHAKGHYKSDIGCTRCKECSRGHGKYTGRKCTEFSNTVCCPQPGMMVIDTTEGPECRLTSTNTATRSAQEILNQIVLCGEGQYLNVSGGDAHCAQCPPGTFVQESSHARVECQSCFSEKWDLHPYCARRSRGGSSSSHGNFWVSNIRITAMTGYFVSRFLSRA